MDKIERIKELVDYLNERSREYYVLNSPTTSDYDFDCLLKELESLEKDTKYVLPYSPTQRVGSDLQDGFKEITRDRIMGSIENSYDLTELKSWLDGFGYDSFLLEPKYDGLSLSIIYENGILKQGTTRGTGYKGTDVTENIKTIKSIPLKLSVHDVPIAGDYHYDDIYIPDTIEIRGEVLMLKSEFNRLNKERMANGLEPFANERNAASGSLKQLDPSVTASRNLIFMPYAVYCDSDEAFAEKYLTKHHMGLDVAEIFGFNSPNYWRCCGSDTVISLVNEFECRFLNNQDYCMDGCVVKLDSVEEQERVGYTQKVPKWAKAFKFKQESVSTILRDVTWQLSREGKLSPVGALDPVEVDGSTISSVYLNNINFINELGLKINSYIFIEKGGGVIPKTTGVDYERNLRESITELIDIDEPDVCPYCGSPVERRLADGANLYCGNGNCREASVQKTIYFVSRGCMNIKNLGEETIRALYSSNIISHWSDLYALTVDDIARCGCGEKNAIKIYDEIKTTAASTPADVVLASIGAPMCGKVTSKKLLESYGSISSFVDAYLSKSFKNDDGTGDVARNMISRYVQDNLWEFNFVKEHLNDECVYSSTPTSDRLAGLTIMATGTLVNFSREGIKDSVLANGGKYASGVSKKLDYLIVGDNAGASKTDKASELGIKMITENEYLEMIG